MKHFFSFLFFCSFFLANLWSNAVAIVDAEQGVYLQLLSSNTSVLVQDQVAITTTTQTFKNNQSIPTLFKYGFPMGQGGTAVGLRWEVGGTWFEADFNAAPQDTTLPGGGGGNQNIAPSLKTYLGATPLYFEIKDLLGVDSLITFELTYVELLPYKNGAVKYFFKNDYSSLQTAVLDEQIFSFAMNSGRLITDVSVLSHSGITVNLTTNQADLSISAFEEVANKNYEIEYTLDANDLGLFSFSILLEDTLGCDTFGQGFCAFVVEPNPNPNADIIPKVFTLIIDRSGSMSGDKMVQAREAASFITNNLNPGDLFNIIDFSSGISSFKPDHVPFTVGNMNDALQYISGLNASGSTNISGAFDTAIPQFANDQGDTYNIIIFFTDGQATSGVTSTQGILDRISSAITLHEVDLNIFTFGIGTSVNKPLLTSIANQNNGIAQFLENDQLADVISGFYETVRNPVLLNTTMDFNPNLVYETYPKPLPNLFKGSQMLVVGRYDIPGLVNVDFNGTAFGQNVNYNYDMVLTDKDSVLFRFLPKLWAKQKAAFLTQELYATSDPGLQETLEAEIENLSLCYGVITDLTSFVDNSGGGGGGPTSIFEVDEVAGSNLPIRILTLSPNPISSHARIHFETDTDLFDEVQFELYSAQGQLLESRPFLVKAKGLYELQWTFEKPLISGMYLLVLKSKIGTVTVKVVVR